MAISIERVYSIYFPLQSYKTNSFQRMMKVALIILCSALTITLVGLTMGFYTENFTDTLVCIGPTVAGRQGALTVIATSLIIGELSTTEEQTIRLIETAGLGVAISKEHDTHTTISSTSSKIASLPSTSKPATSVPTTDRYVKLELVKLNIKPGDRITVSDNLLASIPVSKYVASKTVSSENTVQ